MSSLKRYGYLLVFIIPALMPIAAWLATHTAHADLAAWFPLFFLFVLLPLADYAIGRDSGNPADAAEIEHLESERWYRGLTLACVPVQLALIAWSAAMFVALPFSWPGAVGWLWSQAVISGVLGINVAHELIHKRERLEQFAGGVLLASVGYATFKVEHVRGHHVHVSTPQDRSSAPFGASSWGFVARALIANPVNGWRLEAERLHALGVPWWHWRNELLWWSALTLAFGAALGFVHGLAGTLFFALQALGAAASLEIINYVEHYGLARRRGDDGRYERTTHAHSWNSNYLLSNLMLFQLQRHSDHHENARRRYQALVHHAASPQLPGGYSAMFVLALVPPLWRKIIDPRVPQGLTQEPAVV